MGVMPLFGLIGLILGALMVHQGWRFNLGIVALLLLSGVGFVYFYRAAFFEPTPQVEEVGNFTRSEPTPFTFQPLEVTALGNGVNYGGIISLVFSITNHDTVKHCYDRTAQVPSGWTFDWHLLPVEQSLGLCLEAGQVVTRPLEVRMAAVLPNNLPSGASGEVFVTFIEREEGLISDSASATVTRYREPAYIPNPSPHCRQHRPNDDADHVAG